VLGVEHLAVCCLGNQRQNRYQERNEGGAKRCTPRMAIPARQTVSHRLTIGIWFSARPLVLALRG
jgi:hypothetical protein